MSSKLLDVKVPDIGDYKNVPVIEVLVKDGDTVEKDATLMVLESDKATMEVPSPAAGVVRNFKLKANDKVSQGDLVCELSVAGAATVEAPAAAEEAKPAAPTADAVKPVTDVAPLPAPTPKAEGDVVYAGPATRKFARQLGVDLDKVSGSGPRGRIVIEVQDDGRGINRGRVRQIAIDKGLISPDAVLTDEETDNLIFLPGFSTAAKVSDISGRGVGMDVVRRSVQALGGRISISSRPVEGSIFTLSLPLTLAVLDGMVIDVAGHTLVVPLTAIIESLRPKTEEIKALGPQGSVLAVRDTYVPLVDVGSVLGFRNDLMPATDGVVLLVENEDGGRAGLVADAIQGQRQVVIKSLESNYRQVDGIAAATILGDGRVALILDVDAVVALRRREPRAPEPILHAAE